MLLTLLITPTHLLSRSPRQETFEWAFWRHREIIVSDTITNQISRPTDPIHRLRHPNDAAFERVGILAQEANAAVQSAADTHDLSAIETQYLGRKGSLNELRKLIGTLPKDDRPAFGARINEAVDAVTALIETRRQYSRRPRTRGPPANGNARRHAAGPSSADGTPAPADADGGSHQGSS